MEVVYAIPIYMHNCAQLGLIDYHDGGHGVYHDLCDG
jgi:hypothetical protein